MTGEDRLRTQLEALERTAPADLPPRPSATRSPQWLRFVAPAAVVLLAAGLISVGLPAVLDGLRPLGTAGPTGSHAGSSTPEPSPPAAALEWTALPFPDPDPLRVPRRITNLGDRLLITGGSDMGPAAWYSDDDGATWTKSGFVALSIPGATAGTSAMGPVAESRGILVSISEPGIDESSLGEMWVSNDRGATWRVFRSPPRLLSDITGGPDRFVAVGTAPLVQNDATVLIAHVAIWYSLDGYTWERAEDLPSFAGAIAAGIAEHDGQYVVAGSLPADENATAIWTSADGVRWEPVSVPAGPGIADIEAGPGGFVAIGGSRVPWQSETATLWRSGDGTTWTPAPLVIDTGAGNDSEVALTPTRLSVGPREVLATGMSPSVRYVSSFSWLVEPGSGIGVLQDAWFLADAAPRGDGFIAISLCPSVLNCEAPIQLAFGAAPGDVPDRVAIAERPSTTPDIDCGSLDSKVCSRVLESVYSQHEPQRTGTVTSITLGPLICLDANCPQPIDAPLAVGVTIEFRDRPFLLQLNCLSEVGSEAIACYAAARTLIGRPELGVPYEASTYTHCGLRAIEFDGDRWAIEGALDDGSGNPPPGFGNPIDAGTVTLLSPDEAIYRSQFGVERRITRGGGLPPVEGCL